MSHPPTDPQQVPFDDNSIEHNETGETPLYHIGLGETRVRELCGLCGGEGVKDDFICPSCHGEGMQP